MTTTLTLDPQERFSFGKNWSRFLSQLNEERIAEAEKSLQSYLGCTDLKGRSFIDIGSGSGLFSLAAYRLGATVRSFDYDKDSVGCTSFLKEKFAPGDERWTVEQGSVLDDEFLKRYEKMDIVYSWGVLHHTGHMYKAFDNAAALVKDGGQLFIAIYNDRGGASTRWRWIKKTYVRGSWLTRGILISSTMAAGRSRIMLKDLLTTGNPFKSWVGAYGKDNRGMSAWHDAIDWIGGYPYEYAKADEVFHYFQEKGFHLEKLKTCGGLGCNEFVFRKQTEANKDTARH